MSSVRLEDLSPFGRLALKLDQEFAELVRAGEQMEKVDLESDGGLDDGVRILNRVSQRGQSLAATMQQFAQALQEARDRAEAATKLFAERAQVIQKRRERHDELQGRLEKIKEDLKAAGASLAASQKPEARELTEDDKRRIAADLERLLEPLTGFIQAAQAIKAEAAGANFRRVERQADSIIDSLEASRRKLTQAIGQKP